MRKRILRGILLTLGLAASSMPLAAEEELLKFGDFDSWITRHIKESVLVGGKTQTLYEVGPEGTFDGARAFSNMGGSPWANSNVYAKVAGVVKTNVSVYPDTHGSGKCVKLCSHIVRCKAIGIVNISVMAAGSIYLGTMLEPITSSKNPMSKINVGIPYTRRPKAVKMDYRYQASDAPDRVRETGFSRTKTIPGKDMAEMVCLLQKRWEDADGKLHALRVGTAIVRFGQSTDGWINGKEFRIHYGNITGEPFYKNWMGLVAGERQFYALNSAGRNVPINEEGWAEKDEQPTHLILKIDSSYGGAYIGAEGNTIWIDNVKMVF